MLDSMIDQETGEVDTMVVLEIARLRAQRDFANDNPPLSAIRSYFLNLKGDAQAMRKNWRDKHGLPDDTVYVSFTSFAPDTNE